MGEQTFSVIIHTSRGVLADASVIVILPQITGNLILIAFYGVLLGAAAKMISGGLHFI